MLKPLNDNVVIEPLEVEKKTASGIILTGEASTSKHAEGVVVAVGEGRLNKANPNFGQHLAMAVKAGQRVIYIDYAANKVNHDGKELVIVPESDILAVIE